MEKGVGRTCFVASTAVLRTSRNYSLTRLFADLPCVVLLLGYVRMYEHALE